jgi:hypothetical protein
VEREWWERTVLVLRRPAEVFAALREDGPEESDARQEPVLALVLLAGIGAVLATSAWGRIMDDFELDALTVPVVTFIAGGIYGLTGYFVLGALAYLGARAGGSWHGYRRIRHALAYAAVPLALLLVTWPLRLLLFGEDVFTSGGSDEGAGGAIFRALDVIAVVWSSALVVVAFRALHGWGWGRALGAAVPVLAVPAVILLTAV